MRRTLFASALLLAVCVAAHARQQPHAAGGARLFDSFGEIQWSEMMARLDNFAIELQSTPGSRGVVAAYAAPNKFPGWPLRRGAAARDYLVETRGLDAARVSAVNGGLRDETAFELWVVPAGAETPVKPFDVALLMSGAKAAAPFDRLIVLERGDDPGAEYYFATPYVGDAGIYASFAEVLRRDPSLRGCVIGYTSSDGARTAGRRIASRAKLALARAHAIDVGRVVALGGGRRQFKTVELWLVPPGAALPRPTPEPRPARRRRR